MKRYFTIAISILALVTLASGVIAAIQRSTAMQVRFSAKALPEHGVELITPVDPAFDETAAKYFKNVPPQNLKPLAVFIKNSTSNLVLGYALSWELRDQDGKVITKKTVGYSEPGILVGDKIPKNLEHTTAIKPGHVRCFTWDAQIQTNLPPQATEAGSNADQSSVIRATLGSLLSQATDITVSLDGAFFDDGSFVGPNKSGFFEQMQAILSAKVDLLRELEVASRQGTLDQTIQSIGELSRGPDVTFGQTVAADEYYRHFRKMYATEMTDKLAVYGREKLVPDLIAAYKRARPNLKKK